MKTIRQVKSFLVENVVDDVAAVAAAAIVSKPRKWERMALSLCSQRRQNNEVRKKHPNKQANKQSGETDKLSYKQ